MAIPNPAYVFSPGLQDYFVDKDTGLPLSGGFVYFYDDTNRNVLRTIYELSGNPDNYSFVPTANPVQLSAVGTMMDNNNNDINIYLYPYDSAGNIDLYYVVVTNSLGVLQFTRQAWPPIEFTVGQEIISGEQIENYVANGQFLVNSLIPLNTVNPVTTVGGINNGANYIAAGGWTIERASGSTSVDNYSFPTFGGYVAVPPNSPRYYLNFNCVTPYSTDNKFIGLRFPDVNKFASTTQSYTLTFWVNTSGSAFDVTLNLYKFYGAGGSSPTSMQIGAPINVTPGWSIQTITFIFGVNIGENIGIQNDDYVQIQFTVPNSALNFQLVDVALYQGNIAIIPATSFEVETNADMIANSIYGYTPNPSNLNFNLYLPAVYTQTGIIYDNSSIGRVEYYARNSIPTNTNLLPCDGSTYNALNYSNLGIPYMRLFNALFVNNNNYAGGLWGSGANYFTSYIQDSTTNSIRIATNNASVQTQAADGTSPTGFTFQSPQVSAGHASLNVKAYVANNGGTNVVYVINSVSGSTAAPTVGTTGFTIATVQYNPNIATEFTIQVSSAAALAGQYFTFGTTATNYYVWFKVNGAGADPAPGGTGIQINVLSTYTNLELIYVIKEALNGNTISTLQVAAVPPDGSFFTFNANSVQYAICYRVNGSTTTPSTPGAIQIFIKVSSGFTVLQVVSATVTQMNSVFFAVPDLTGQFIRITDSSSLIDTGLRGNYYISNAGFTNSTGSYESDQIQGHFHTGTLLINGTSSVSTIPVTSIQIIELARTTGASPESVTASFTTNAAGINETRPANTYLTTYIRY